MALRLVLASASVGRREILRRAGVPCRVVVSAVDEEGVLASYAAPPPPAEAAQVLARAKCEEVASRLTAGGPEGADLVLGCDSMFELDGVPYGKPHRADVAVERWRRMSGRTGVLHTGHWVVDLRSGLGGGVATATEVQFAVVDEEEIAAYVATGEPLGCAGGFTIDGYGGAFVEGLVGDPHTVVGLSLPALRVLLARTFGVSWPQLWGQPHEER